MKPDTHRHSCTVTKDIPYRLVDGDTKESQAGEGILRMGRVVWIDQNLERCTAKPHVEAYAHGIGLVQIDPRCLSHLS
jgi:hypothetical protein